MLGLYLHIPFCSAICHYCNFARGLLDEGLKARYVEALAREIGDGVWPAPEDAPPRDADTVYFGGGTPSLLEPAEVARLIAACRARFVLDPGTEITLEVNPESATVARLEAFRAAGVTRISFGVQSFDDEELARLGRAHSAARAREAVREARQAGFANVSLDLMLWLPGQSFASWLRTVDEAIALAPDHLSLYLLELYPNAPLKEAMARAPWAQAPDDEAADMYLAGLERLEAAGFRQYEISNVARPGFECRHNLKYWLSGDWWGFGCAAHSTTAGWRWQNVATPTEYVDRQGRGQSPVQGLTRLSADVRRAEAVFTALRLTDGVDGSEIAARFGLDPWVEHGVSLTPFLEAGLMWRRGARLGLSRHGMLVANEILATFV